MPLFNYMIRKSMGSILGNGTTNSVLRDMVPRRGCDLHSYASGSVNRYV